MTIIPIYNYLIVPNATMFFQTDRFQSLTGVKPKENDDVMLIVMKEQQSWDELNEDSFYPIGLSGTVTEVHDEGYAVIRTHDRVNINAIKVFGMYKIELNISRRYDTDEMDPEEENQRLSKLKAAILEYASEFQWGVIARNYIVKWESVADVAAALAMWISGTDDDKYAVLAEDSQVKRTKMLESMIYEYVEMARLSNEAQNAQKKDTEKLYRKAAIQKQMDYLQKELDEMDPDNVSDVRKFELKINDSGMNETAEKEARKVLNRLKQEGQNSAESGMLYDYLDFVTGLSWTKEKSDEIDLEEAEKVLDEDHFGLKKVKERIIQQIAVMNLQKKQSGSILLFAGAPGTGKTSIGRSIAESLHREYVRVSLGGVRDEADIRGHRRTYIGAMPGRIMDGIHKSGVSNPVMVLDEVDKLSVSFNGDPASALLEVLDPEQNSTFTDHYMNVPYDLSDVLFICTANTLDTIPEPLLNRMEVIDFPGYTATDKLQIARRHLIPKAMESTGISPDRLEITEEALESIIADYTAESGVRGLKKRLDTLCRVAAVEIVRGSDEKVVVEASQLRDYLDMKPIIHDHILAKKRPGIVTGLAWTRAGGEILFIETLFTKGEGKTIITGQLGDVMKESVQLAVSLVKSMFPDKSELFRENDLHIHVPSGAVPKDGPSAGITLTTAIASLVMDKAVSPEFAMTGEITLRGAVTPIGGLNEKLMAAQRSGITTVFIPAENEPDLRDVDAEIKEKLEIIPVRRIAEVLLKCGLISSEVEKAAV